MAYYPDLSIYEYLARGNIDPNIINVGWLDATHTYPTGATSEKFIEQLWVYCQQPVQQTRGLHECELCMRPDLPFFAKRGNETLLLGAGEIRVPGKNGIIYAAPNLIYHYVVDHQYLPPEEFIQAVLANTPTSA